MANAEPNADKASMRGGPAASLHLRPSIVSIHCNNQKKRISFISHMMHGVSQLMKIVLIYLYPMDFKLQLGGQFAHPQELTLVSDWGE
ncbi:hypothetical protein [Serratia silvae]|uniref:Uncharacterized protein n=1 Tax=Serratia silvae TaxID=2824122 RepID=A0ABT0KDH8_9GAMM|nr:hypothetical protein [Serratia silvae]MCL1030085.1 hypothetical protein [Serratia silvae]